MKRSYFSAGAVKSTVVRLCRAGPARAAGAAVLAQRERGGGDHGEREGAVRQRAGGRGEGAVEGVADEREARRPDERAEQAPRQEGSDAHARGAGEERRDGAHDPDEAPDEDRLRSVAVEEALDELEAGGRDADARAVRLQEPPSEPAAEEEAGEVAEGGGRPGDEDHHREAHVALGGDDAAEHDRGLARRDETDERAGLEERERGDERVGPRAERLREVGEGALEIRRLNDAGGERDERGGGEQPAAEQHDPGPPRRPGEIGRRDRGGAQDVHAAADIAGSGRAGSGQAGAAARSGAGAPSGASSSPQRAIVRRRPPSAASPIGAGSQIAIAR